MPDPEKKKHPEMEALIADLKAWCKAKHGRNLKIAEVIGVSPQLVSDWINGNADPTVGNWLNLRDFLKKQKRKRI
jgi:transcriptional regulator with XRE-family HTH domain